MKKTIKITFLMMLVVSLFLTNIGLAVVNTVITEPEEIEKKSTFTFKAEIDDENILGAWFWCQECNANTGICFEDTIQNLSLTLQDGYYQTTVTLKHDKSTYVKYTIFVETDEGWKTYKEDSQIDFVEPQDGDGTGNGDDNGSPGFELITILVAIIIGVIILKRKRF